LYTISLLPFSVVPPGSVCYFKKLRCEMENLSLEQQQQLRDTLQDMADLFVETMNEIAKLLNLVIDAIRKSFEGIVRFYVHLQLLEWRMPECMAKFVSAKIPQWMAYQIVLGWLHRKLEWVG
jgi:hypothetical protein